MDRKWIITCSGGLILGLILVILWMSLDRQSPVAFGVSISRSEAEQAIVFKASITNKMLRVVKINGRVQVTYLDEAGREVAGDFVRLAGSGTDVGGLPPRGWDSVLLRASAAENIAGVRLRFTYSFDAAPLNRAVSWALKGMGIGPSMGSGKYPLNGWWGWLSRNGFLDGKRRVAYQGTWLADAKLLSQNVSVDREQLTRRSTE